MNENRSWSMARRRNLQTQSDCDIHCVHYILQCHIHVHDLMRDEKEGRNKQARQSNTAHPRLPRVELEHTTLYTLDRAYMYMYIARMPSLENWGGGLKIFCR